MAERIDRDQVIGFRLSGHGLDQRVPVADLVDAAACCGIQNSPPWAGPIAFHARVDGVTPDLVDEAVAARDLLLTWSMRGAPYYVPTADAGVFTAGVLPTTERALRHFIPGVEYSVDRLGMSVTEAVDRAEAAVREVLAGRSMAITELGVESAAVIAPGLSTERLRVWEAEGPHAKGQSIGEAVVHFCLRILALRQVVCFAPRTGNKAPFVFTEEWLPRPTVAIDGTAARAELLRRHLRCYGPTTPASFAWWLGVSTGDACLWWDLLEPELVEVDFGGPRWMLARDLDILRAATVPVGVRLLPPRDPYLQIRDRATLVDPSRHREVWKTVGDPGTVLVDGELVGTWRSRKAGRNLQVTFRGFGPLGDATRKRLAVEAEHVARVRGASTVSVEGLDVVPGE